MDPWIKNIRLVVYSLIIPLGFIGIALYAGWMWILTIDENVLVDQINSISFQQFLLLFIIIGASIVIFLFIKRAGKEPKLGGTWKNTLAIIVISGSFITLIILILFAFVDTFVDTDNDGVLEFDRVFGAHSIQLIGLILPVLGT
jgi:hypothetical protein